MRTTVLRSAFFLMHIAFSSYPLHSADTIVIDERIVAAITPILQASLSVRQNDTEAREHERGRLLEKVLRDQSPVGDEGLVALLSFDVGAGNDEDILHQITVRGRRLLPLLMKYRNKTVVLKDETAFLKLAVPGKVRQQSFKTAIDFIEKGKVWGVD